MGEALFLSDLHLAAERPRVTRRFLDLLAGRAREAEVLYILGDLFDVWVGDDDSGEPIPAVISALKALTATGVACRFMAGNRDFLVGEGFAAATGCTLMGDAERIDLAGIPTLLMHGDLLCTDDTAYQAFRARIRQPEAISAFLARPLTERRALADHYRRRSGEATSLKAEDIMDVNPDAVNAALARHGARRLIHGHTHRPARHDLGEGAERWVLPEWTENGGGILAAREGRLRLEPLG